MITYPCKPAISQAKSDMPNTELFVLPNYNTVCLTTASAVNVAESFAWKIPPGKYPHVFFFFFFSLLQGTYRSITNKTYLVVYKLQAYQLKLESML